MNNLVELLGYDFNQRALLAAAVIGLVSGSLSGYVVLRKSALFTGALAHTLFPGITVGFLLFGVSAISAFVGGLSMALIIGLFAVFLAQRTRIDRDSALAVLWATAFAAGLLLHDHAHLHVQIEDYLFGNILGLSNLDLWFIYISGVAVMLTLVSLQRPLLILIFEEDVARSQGIRVRGLNYLLMGSIVLVMITSVQAVGVILALGLIVAPGATLYLLVDSPRKLFWGGGILGSFLSVMAILLSNLFNLRTGATMVVLLGATFLLTCILSPKYGLLANRAGTRSPARR